MLAIAFLFTIGAINAQSTYLTPSDGYKTNDIFPASSFAAFDVHEDFMYANDGDTIHCFDIESGELLQKYGRPGSYTAFASFLTVSPDGAEIWAGYTTTENTDDRIYSINTQTGEWTLEANFTANFDLEFFNDKVLISGLNGTNWGDPNFIFLMDDSGNNMHRKIIETGGSPAGFAVSEQGTLFYGTSFFSGLNTLYSWEAADITAVVEDVNADFLTIEDAIKLSDLPASASGCDVDAADNLVFNFNDFTSDKILARWNGISGDGLNFDTIALASDQNDWLKMVKTRGNITIPEPGNNIFTASFGRPIAEIHPDYLPILTHKIPTFSGSKNDATYFYDLTPHFTDPDDPDVFTFEITGNSEPLVADVSVDGNNLVIDFLAAGQSNVFVQATCAGQSVSASFVVGTYPQIEGDFEVSGFEDLTLETNSYWNGSDLSGEFQSGPLNFPNYYNESWASWTGWAYSNMADDSTAGYLNQYSAITAHGFDGGNSKGANYGVGFVPVNFTTFENTPIPLYFKDEKPHLVKGLYLTNSTYAALNMEFGDEFTEKFGGPTGNDPDYFKLLVFGYTDGNVNDSIEFFLADYRFENNDRDFIIKTWQWLELSTLGEVDSLKFTLESSDTGDYGMNTPGYFCIDQVYINPESTSLSESEEQETSHIHIYPNPATDFIRINTGSEISRLSIFDINGRLLFENDAYSSGSEIDLGNFKNGIYAIKVQTDASVNSAVFIKK